MSCFFFLLPFLLLLPRILCILPLFGCICILCTQTFPLETELHGQNDAQDKKIRFVYRKMMTILLKYFNSSSSNNTELNSAFDWDLVRFFPFCGPCRDLVGQLCLYVEELEAAERKIQKSMARISIKIIQSEGGGNGDNKHSDEDKDDPEVEMDEGISGIMSKLRRDIVQRKDVEQDFVYSLITVN